MMKIRFTVDRWLDTEDRTKTPRFKKGSTHDLSEASAYRWVRRNVAVYVVVAPVVEVKLDRPMMVETRVIDPHTVSVASDFKPKKAKPKKAKKPTPKGDATVREIVTGPALPVRGSGKNGGPGWDD